MGIRAVTMQGSLCRDVGLRLWREEKMRRFHTRHLRVNISILSIPYLGSVLFSLLLVEGRQNQSHSSVKHY
ncbi:hypothetical protein PITC_053140 [Penicillium italicum]|uniref:Uncharacterized protein n=1 Tax=Penicillium italicum TaxID=40296 RepID=A0A0A2KMB3_PENIT|nr:hypothetical protein PITC_053140 [Penicillium italicum]